MAGTRAIATLSCKTIGRSTVEHLEDLRTKPRTREELGRLLGRAATRRPILLTLTRTKGDAEMLAWLRARAEVFSLD
jgi:hypothetical protein